MSRAHANANSAPAMVTGPRYKKPGMRAVPPQVAMNLHKARIAGAWQKIRCTRRRCERQKEGYYRVTAIGSSVTTDAGE